MAMNGMVRPVCACLIIILIAVLDAMKAVMGLLVMGSIRVVNAVTGIHGMIQTAVIVQIHVPFQSVQNMLLAVKKNAAENIVLVIVTVVISIMRRRKNASMNVKRDLSIIATGLAVHLINLWKAVKRLGDIFLIREIMENGRLLPWSMLLPEKSGDLSVLTPWIVMAETEIGAQETITCPLPVSRRQIVRLVTREMVLIIFRQRGRR